MAEITKYIVVNEDGDKETFWYDTYPEAEEHARKYGGRAVIEYEFEFADSSVVWTAPGVDPGDARRAE